MGRRFAPKFDDPARRALAVAVVASVGDIVAMTHPEDFPIADETKWLLEAKRRHPALQQLSVRRQLPTMAADRHYAFLRASRDGSERMLAVMNFRPSGETVRVDLSGVDHRELVDLRTSVSKLHGQSLEVCLPPFGYALYLVR
jgi:Maltogenic Amylase, C-terminal domain